MDACVIHACVLNLTALKVCESVDEFFSLGLYTVICKKKNHIVHDTPHYYSVSHVVCNYTSITCMIFANTSHVSILDMVNSLWY